MTDLPIGQLTLRRRLGTEYNSNKKVYDGVIMTYDCLWKVSFGTICKDGILFWNISESDRWVFGTNEPRLKILGVDMI
jgi:hypothetical protein